MANSSLTPRRVACAVGLVLVVSFSGCSTPAPSISSATKSALSVYERRVENFEAAHANGNSHARRILYADALLHLDEPRKAIQVLIETELIFPEAYMNALYLGMAFEMVGDLKSARHWVAKGIERNVDARGGTQWLHLAMLEARLALAKDPEWLNTHSVLESNTHRTAEEILHAIKVQLAVRGDFGLKPDLVVCDLYFEAGICAPRLPARRQFFAQSLAIGTLRRAEIERQEKIYAQGHASFQAH